MKRIISIALASVLLLSACVHVDPVRDYSQLQQSDQSATLSVLTRDGAVYHLDSYDLENDALQGKGSREMEGFRASFDGDIPLDDIEYAQVERRDESGTIFTVAAAVVFTGFVAAAILRESKTEIRSENPESESCPYVYSWNGEEYVLEAETFGTSLGKSLQRGTRHVLPSLHEEQGELRIRMTNERPETHYIDRVRLFRYAHRADQELYLDNNGGAWLCSASTTMHRTAAAKDGGEYIVRCPEDAETAMLLVTAKNREMTGGIFQETFTWLGDDALRFIRDLEQDPETIASLKEWLRRCGLQVRMGTDAHMVGRIEPEGTEIPFTRALPFSVKDLQGEQLRLQLQSLPGLWEVLDVRIAWDPVAASPPEELRMLRCIDENGGDRLSAVQAEDGEYCTLLPPQRIDLRFANPTISGEERYTYAVEAAGYLHLWYTPGKTSELFADFEAVPESARLAFVKSMMQRPDVVLPLLARLVKE
ncbi:hypothetical protein KQI65_13515 [bacterium]|nr:hypothetical protein [bacterium]